MNFSDYRGFAWFACFICFIEDLRLVSERTATAAFNEAERQNNHAVRMRRGSGPG